MLESIKKPALLEKILRALALQLGSIEERDGRLFAWEFKWSTNAKVRIPKTFTRAYPEVESSQITPKNYASFLMKLS